VPVLPQGKPIYAELLEELVAEFLAAALIPPGVLLARVQPERHRGVDREGRVLADIIIRDGVAHLDGAVGGGVERLQARHDLAGGKHLDLEFVVGHVSDVFGDLGRAAIDRVQRLREARGHAPLDLGRGLRDRGRGHRGSRRGASCRNFQEITTLHQSISLFGTFPMFFEPALVAVIRSAASNRRRSGGGFNMDGRRAKRDEGMTALNQSRISRNHRPE
jgi:hypothetical protein